MVKSRGSGRVEAQEVLGCWNPDITAPYLCDIGVTYSSWCSVSKSCKIDLITETKFITQAVGCIGLNN